MDQLTQGLSISVNSPQKEVILDRFLEQMAEWGIALPEIEPVVLDFGLDDFDRYGLIEYWIANEVEAGYCGKYLFLFDGQACPVHCHKTKMETFFVVQGQLEVVYDQRHIILNPGDVLRVEPRKFHGFKGLGPTLMLELSMPCIVDDNHFEQPEIPIGSNYKNAVH